MGQNVDAHLANSNSKELNPNQMPRKISDNYSNVLPVSINIPNQQQTT